MSIIIFLSCSSIRWTTLGNGGRMKIVYDLNNLQKHQIDSICNNDSISNKFVRNWLFLPLVESESGDKIEKYMYIKRLDSLEILYVVTKNKSEETYGIIKRITY